MLITSLLILLIFSTLSPSISNNNIINHTIILNRLGSITLIFTLILFILSIDIVSISPNLNLFNNLFNLTPKYIPYILIIFIISIIMLIYISTNHRYDIKSPFLSIIIIINLIGLLLLPLINDLLSLYIIIELQSYSLYIITGLHNRSYNGSRASMLYFLMGGIASTIILLSIYFIYWYTGTTNLTDISLLINYDNNIYNYFNILLLALIFKMGMAPLHNWSISVYNYAPTYITLYISIVAKLSIIIFIFTNLYLFNNYLLIIIFYLSLFIGSYKPLYQINIKVILAYSGILNFGYLLLTLITYDLSFYIYLIQYIITHLLLFLIILAISQYIDKPISKWSPLLYINQLRFNNKVLALCMILALFSLIGIPPLSGFYGKFYILISAIYDNYILESFIIIICSIVATYYYANIIKILLINFNNNNFIINNNFYINSSLAYMISVLTLIIIIYFLLLSYITEGLYLITI